MVQERYQYGTSPRKIDPDYNREVKKTQKKKQLKIVEELPRQQIKVSKEQRKNVLLIQEISILKERIEQNGKKD